MRIEYDIIKYVISLIFIYLLVLIINFRMINKIS